MKLLSWAHWSFLCIVLIVAQTIVSNGQNINRGEKKLKIRIDFQSARAVVDLLSRNQVESMNGRPRPRRCVSFKLESKNEAFEKDFKKISRNFQDFDNRSFLI